MPKVEEKLGDDLLFGAIWDHVLDDRARRMLYRMTLLRRPWDLALQRELGEPGEPAETAEATAGRLRRTSLLEQVELTMPDELVRRDTIHPATVRFVARQFGDDRALRRQSQGRIGTFFEAKARTSPYIGDVIEGGYHLLQAQEYDRALGMLGPASDWLRDHGRIREGLQVLEPFLAEAVRRAMTPERVVPLLVAVGLAYSSLSQVERAIGSFEKALAVAREIGDRENEGAAVGNLGIAYRHMGQVERACDYFEQHLVIAGEIGDRKSEVAALGNLGVAYAVLGQVERAIGSYEQALVIAREIGDRRGEGTSLGNLGIVYASQGQVERAISSFEQALVIAREIGDRWGEADAVGNLGNAYTFQGRIERAIGSYEQALVIAREIGDRRGEGTSLGNLGVAYAALGQVERAVGLLEQALRIGEEIKDPRITEFATAQLEQLRGGGSDERPEEG